MNKFAIKKLRNNKQEQQAQQEQECSTEFLNNADEFSNQTSEEKRIYDQIVSKVCDSGSIKLNDSLPKIEYLLYLLFDLHDEFLDIIFLDPTQEYLDRVRSKLDINDTTKEIVRKNIHYALYHHLLTYDYRTLKSIAIDLSQQKSQKIAQDACQ